jgi:hypothetical protein
MSKTTTIVLVVGGLAVVGGVVYFTTRKPTPPVPRAAAGGNWLTAISTIAPAAIGAISGYFKSSPPSTSVVDTTAVSNYLADATAASDSASGVVGFGGWD